MTRRLTGFPRASLLAVLLAAGVAAAPTGASADGFWSFLPFVSAKADLDFNGDGAVRISLLSPAARSGGAKAGLLASDLEALIKSATDKPVRVSLVAPGEQCTLMGWWYSPDSKAAQTELFGSKQDLLLLAEDEEIATGYPEFFFEGVRCISGRAREAGLRTALVMMSEPASSFHDKRIRLTANCAYRVGNGCGVEVIPAACAWQQALIHNRLPGDTPVKTRAAIWASAAAVFVQLTGVPVPSRGLDTFWTTRKTAEALAVSAKEAIEAERIRQHYARPFSGVIRTAEKFSPILKIYQPTSAENDPVSGNLAFILGAAHISVFCKTPADWYANGLDRFSVPFDLVYGDQQQIAQYLDRGLHAGIAPKPEFAAPFIAAYTRMPEGLADPADILRRIEPLLLSGYDSAREKGVAYIPYPLAWARAARANPELVAPTPAGRRNDWLSYMIASMIYTAATGRCQPTPSAPGPHHANAVHPAGYHAISARIGYDTVMQLSTLSESRNAVILRCDGYRASPGSPCFAGVRLLDRPSSDVRVYCGTDQPEAIALSSGTLDFTPENYDIEQTVRISAATNTPMIFTRFMASAHSSDGGIDGKADSRLMILNLDESSPGSFALSEQVRAVSPSNGYAAAIAPTLRPSQIVAATVRQHGVATQSLVFAPDAFSAQPIALHPTRDDYEAGKISVSISAESRDLRYNGKKQSFAFALSREGRELPEVRIVSPAGSKPIDGPAFVTASAEAEAKAGVKRTALYLGRKFLGSADGPRCSASAENGPPQSRLTPGSYQLWAETLSADGVLLATPPFAFSVSQSDK